MSAHPDDTDPRPTRNSRPGLRAEIAVLRLALNEIARVAKTSEIPDRHGNLHQACDTTCLIDVGHTAEKALSYGQQMGDSQ